LAAIHCQAKGESGKVKVKSDFHWNITRSKSTIAPVQGAIAGEKAKAEQLGKH
jgi:hypothetical protein